MTHTLGDQLVGQFAEEDGLDTDATLSEALEYGFVTSMQKEALLAQIQGVFKAMIRGVETDGNGRKIDGFVSINPFARGRLDDICDEYTASVAKVVAIARMLKEFDIDTSDWSFVIEGSVGSIVVNVVTTGEAVGFVRSGEDIMINGLHLAAHAADGDIVKFKVAVGNSIGYKSAIYKVEA